jgi:RNA-binding protein|tara:strand:- start:16 stop:309 length:294 start_codon:yes stop_codon:yes gene_type:complete
VSTNKIQKKTLRQAAHHLDPAVWIGKNGITENVIKEITHALDHHELIKIKILQVEKKERGINIKKICMDTNAELISNIGNVLTLYKKNTKNSDQEIS